MPYAYNKSPRVVPWSSTEEWRRVYQLLYSDELISREEQRANRLIALKLMKCWAVRGRVPVSVESTLLLVDAWLQDQERERLSTDSLRQLYSLAIIRFVNGLVDLQQKGNYALSIQVLAQQINLPRYFVDLRHQATHDHLPSIHLLRKACEQSLEWLRTNYWVVQEEYANKVKLQLRDLLHRYQKEMMKVVTRNGEHQENNENDGGIMNPNAAALKSLDGILQACNDHQARTELIPILLDDNLLVPLEKSKRPQLNNGTNDQELLQVWTAALIVFAGAWPTFSMDMLEVLCKRLYSSENDIPPSFEKSAAESDARSKSYRATLLFWAKFFLESEEIHPSITSEVFRALLKYPNVFTHALVKIAQKRATDEILSDDTVIMIKKLSEMSKQRKRKETDSFQVENIEIDVESMQKRFKLLIEKSGSDSNASVDSVCSAEPVHDSAWKLSTAPDWIHTAIGLIPSSLAVEKNLEGVIPSWQRSSVPSDWSSTHHQTKPATHGILPDFDQCKVISIE